MELKDFVPQKSKFKVKIDESEVTLKLRPYSLADDAWIDSNFPMDQRVAIFEEVKMIPISEMIWHQLEIESKKLVASIKLLDVNDDGEEIEIKATGAVKLQHCIKGVQEYLGAFKALLAAKGLSTPALAKMAEVEEVKKNLQAKQSA